MAIFLSAGLLKSTQGCTIGDYKIDWRLESSSGSIVFITGIGSDTLLQAQHPFVDEIVPPGDLYPVIDYVYINGSKVTSVYELNEYFGKDLVNCLPFHTVDQIDCTTQYTPNSVYDIVINYVNNADNTTDKSRIIKFYIGATTTYLAWSFFADIVADGLKLYYCTALDSVGILLDNYIIGKEISPGNYVVEDLNPVNYPINPRVISSTQTLSNQYIDFRNLLNLSGQTYTAGDYIKIEIIGSVLTPTNNNTNWKLSLACLTAFDKATFNTQDFAKIDLTTNPYMVWDEATCEYRLNYKLLEAANTIIKLSATSIDIIKYLSVYGFFYNSSISTGGGYVDMLEDNALIRNDWKTKISQSWLAYAPYVCQDLPSGEEISYVKTNGKLDIIFSNVTEYDDAVSEMETIMLHANWIAAKNATPTDLIWYLRWEIVMKEAISCGDAFIYHVWDIHHTSIITYDAPTRTISFTCPIITNQYVNPLEQCNNLWITIDNLVNRINEDAVKVETFNSNITYTNPIGALVYNLQIENDSVVIHYMYYYLPQYVYDDIITPAELTAHGFCLDGTKWKKYKTYDRLTFKDVSSHGARMNHFTLERQKFLRTGLCADVIEEANYELVYETPEIIGFATVTGTLTNATP